MQFNIPDDSGFLAIVDPDAYQGFVHADWTWHMLREHFLREMNERRLLIWGTGSENMWNVEVVFRPTLAASFREVSGCIEASRGRLLLTNYEALAMTAQYPDVTLPLPHEESNLISVLPGLHDCRIVQLQDPADDVSSEEAVGFIYEFTPAISLGEHWCEIPWCLA